MRATGRPDAGQVVPLVAAVFVVVLIATLLVARVAVVSADRARARAAADAAALAGALGGRSRSVQLAEANHAELMSYEAVGDTVEVRVRVGEVEATARASTDPGDDRSEA